MIVADIILIIAAIAIPNLIPARMSAHETSSVGSIPGINTAEFRPTRRIPTLYWNGSVYVHCNNDVLRAFSWNAAASAGQQLSTSPVSVGSAV